MLMALKLDLTPMMQEPIFDWVSDDLTETLHIRTGIMERFLQRNPEFAESIRVKTLIEDRFAEYIKTDRGLEVPHLATITPERLEVPVIGLAMPDNFVLLVDGHHRYYLRYIMKLGTIDYYVFPAEVWPHFKLSDHDRKTLFE